jgi:hypothetical protein
MLTNITYGTYLFFGIMTFMGAGFIWWFFPEVRMKPTKFALKSEIVTVIESRALSAGRSAQKRWLSRNMADI